jgi:hypothetical protein
VGAVPLPRRLPRRALSAAEWQEVVERLQCRLAFRDEGEAPRACDLEPGSEEKVRELRRRYRERLSLFSPRDRQLPHTAPGPCRALSRLADELAAQRHEEASERARLAAEGVRV